jgi:hypothetical protein
MATALKTCPVCGKEHKRPKYCSLEHQLQANREWRAKNAKRYRAKYRGCYRAAYSPSVAPKREMCKCPMCETKFLGSPWQGPRSYCDSCERIVKGISNEVYRIGTGWATGYNEGGSYYA